MSMPTFPDIPDRPDFESSIYQVISSIALEELGLSHILNTEGEKLQYILGTLPGSTPVNPSIDQLLEVNQSIRDLLTTVSMNQMFLFVKMSAALKALVKDRKKPGGPTEPPGRSA